MLQSLTCLGKIGFDWTATLINGAVGSDFRLTSQAESQPAATAPAQVPVVVSFLWDPVVIAILLASLVLLLVLLAIKLGFYHQMERSSRTLVKRLGELIVTGDEPAAAPPPVVELAPRTPLPTRNEVTATARPGKPADETVDLLSSTKKGPPSPTPKEIKEIEKTDLGRAALLWQKIGAWEQAADCYFKVGNLVRSADIWLALEQAERALPLLKDALQQEPEDESVRLKTIDTLFDLGRDDDAEQFIRASVDLSASEIKVSASFLEGLARDYESKHKLDTAIAYYQRAIGMNSASAELEHRIQFLITLKNLAQGPAVPREISSPAQELLAKYIRDTNVRSGDSAEVPVPPPGEPLKGHEIIVGHLALGFQQYEPPRSIRSVFSLSRRFQLERLLAESPRGAVFQATDRLLAFTVALRLYRLPEDFGKLEILKERLRAISQLNHPNLAKITFVDREGPVIRVATEYLPGGNLREFLRKLGGVGLPLIIRMAMHLASALHTSHVRGIPHGDVRPENLIIGPDQRIKLLDFAISPIPVTTFDFSTVNMGENMETPRPFDFAAHNEGVQSDLLQFADIIEFMLQHARKTVDPVASGVNDTSEELKELVTRIRAGSFTTILRLWQILEQIFDRTLPSQSSSEKPRL